MNDLCRTLHYHVTPTVDAEGDGHRIRLLCQTQSLNGFGTMLQCRDLGVWPLGLSPAVILAEEAARQEVEAWKAQMATCLNEHLTWIKEQA
jgi:hypothetical protein